MNFICTSAIAMMMAVLVSACGWSDYASARHLRNHDPVFKQDVKIEEIPLEGMGAEQFRRLLDEAHHSIEAEESSGGNFLTRWRDKFRFKQSMLNAYRWYSMHRGVPHVENAAANLTAMLVTSHGLETVGGLAMAGTGAAHGFSGVLDWVMTTVGVTITVPGLDPLCLLLVGAYHRWPEKMDRILTVPRLFLVTGVRAGLEFAGVPAGYLSAALADRLKIRFKRAISADPGVKVADLADGIEYTVFGAREDQFITLEVKKQPDGRMSMSSVAFSPTAPAMVRTYLSQRIKPFGWNIRDLVMGMDMKLGEGRLGEMAALPYVEAVDEPNLRVTLKPGAFPFYDIGSCEGLLGADSRQSE